MATHLFQLLHLFVQIAVLDGQFCVFVDHLAQLTLQILAVLALGL